jgi:hypothetical protein
MTVCAVAVATATQKMMEKNAAIDSGASRFAQQRVVFGPTNDWLPEQRYAKAIKGDTPHQLAT